MRPTATSEFQDEASALQAAEIGRVADSEAEGALSLDEIIFQLNQRYEHSLPVAALREAQRRRKEITPRLIDLIETATEGVRANADTDSGGAFFALYLLAEFRAREALPAVLRAISLPGAAPDEIFEGALDEDISRILVALSDDPVELLDKLIGDSSLDFYLRWNCATTLLTLVRDGLLTRESAVERLRMHLRNANKSEDWETANFVVYSLHAYGPREAIDDIEEAYQRGFVEDGLVGWSDFEECLRDPESHFRRKLEHCRPSGIHDTVEVLSGWACFQESPQKSGETSAGLMSWDEFDDRMDGFADLDLPGAPATIYEPATIRNRAPRVGRNDPCPCGSLKKYKKCCGRS